MHLCALSVIIDSSLFNRKNSTIGVVTLVLTARKYLYVSRQVHYKLSYSIVLCTSALSVIIDIVLLGFLTNLSKYRDQCLYSDPFLLVDLEITMVSS